jgi:hypothetical protein
VTLLRPVGKTVNRISVRIDGAENGVLGINHLVQNGDVIYVPEGKPRQTTLDKITRFLPGLAFFLN